jgi:ATP-dependent Clp protease protease subunit
MPAQSHPLLKLNRRSLAVSASAASLSPLSLWEGQGIRAESEGHGGAASGDVMGLLLRERIIFLGNEIEDFLADAIVSQLLLLDAMDSESDIRLFVNSPGGSLRCVLQCKIPFHSFMHLLYFL